MVLTAQLVYQNGLANVFINSKRVLQHAYGPCEWYCRGLEGAGFIVEVKHCDKCGDIANEQWEPGPGDLWKESKHPYKHPSTRVA